MALWYILLKKIKKKKTNNSGSHGIEPYATCTSPIMHLICFVFDFSWTAVIPRRNDKDHPTLEEETKKLRLLFTVCLTAS